MKKTEDPTLTAATEKKCAPHDCTEQKGDPSFASQDDGEFYGLGQPGLRSSMRERSLCSVRNPMGR